MARPNKYQPADCALVQMMEKEYLIWDVTVKAVRPIALLDHQRRILNKVFTEVNGELPYRTFVYSAPKKSGKTEIAAAITYAFLRVYGGNCYSIANDKDQARTRMFDRVTKMLRYMADQNHRLFMSIVDPGFAEKISIGNMVKFAHRKQKNPEDHWLTFIPADYSGEAGGVPALTVWDELWAYSKESMFRLWEEMQPVPTIPYSMRLVTTYAGWYGESTLLWNLYESVVNPDPHTQEPRGNRVPGLEDLPVFQQERTLIYWDHEPRMPWHTDKFLSDSQNDPACKGRESEWRRLWCNEWTTGLDAFLPIELIDELMEMGRQLGLKNNMPGPFNLPADPHTRGTDQPEPVAVPW